MSKSGKAVMIVIAGIAITIVGYYYKIFFVNIPYQEAPEELIQARDNDIIISNGIMHFGLFIFLLGLAWLVLQLFDKNDTE